MKDGLQKTLPERAACHGQYKRWYWPEHTGDEEHYSRNKGQCFVLDSLKIYTTINYKFIIKLLKLLLLQLSS